MGKQHKLEIRDDVWVPTQCGRCFSNCGIRVRRVNGVAVQIEGNAASWQGSRGGVCGKGASGLQLLYDPNRLNVPLRRTNPEKGLYADPKWKEISWEEALDEITEKLKKVLADDPRKIFLQSTTVRSPTASQGWRRFLATILGTPNGSVGGAGIHCGAGGHMASGLMHASWDILPDYRLCNYAIYWGSNNGHATGHAAMVLARCVAEAMERGMKLVVFDPVCNYSAAKATEWIPIVPGTDSVVALAMSNVIINELGIWDNAYLKLKTNAPYLAGPDGRFVRDKETGKPLVWDAGGVSVKVYDDPTVADYAIEGNYSINGMECRPAFQLFKEHLKQYTPEMASKISEVPSETIRRIATEFAAAAQIGSTVTIEGHQLPFQARYLGYVPRRRRTRQRISHSDVGRDAQPYSRRSRRARRSARYVVQVLRLSGDRESDIRPWNGARRHADRASLGYSAHPVARSRTESPKGSWIAGALRDVERFSDLGHRQHGGAVAEDRIAVPHRGAAQLRLQFGVGDRKPGSTGRISQEDPLHRELGPFRQRVL